MTRNYVGAVRVSVIPPVPFYLTDERRHGLIFRGEKVFSDLYLQADRHIRRVALLPGPIMRVFTN